jgi:phosphocarrier protein
MTDTVTRDVEIVNKRGLHARASAKFAALTGQYDDVRIHVSREDQTVDGDSIMDLLMLAAGPGATIAIRGQGPRAGEAVDALVALVASRFGEDE